MILANILNMVIKESKTADALDKTLRSSPILMKIMTDDSDSLLTGCWIDWFSEENFKKVCSIIFEYNLYLKMGSGFSMSLAQIQCV